MRRFGVLLGLAMVGFGALGCTSSAPVGPTDNFPSRTLAPLVSQSGSVFVTVPVPTPTPTPTPTPSSPTQIASAQALALIPIYYATLDRVGESATVSINSEIDDVAADTANDDWKTTYGIQRSKGELARGGTVVVRTKVTAISLVRSGDVLSSARIQTCLDISTLHLYTQSGQNITVPTRPNFFVENLSLQKVNVPTHDGWRVVSYTNKGVSSCAGF